MKEEQLNQQSRFKRYKALKYTFPNDVLFDESLRKLKMEDQVETLVRMYGLGLSYTGALPRGFHRLVYRRLPVKTREFMK